MDENINEMVGNMLDQLQANNREARTVSREPDPIKKEELEDFVVQKSGKLINNTLEMVDTVRDYIISAPESKDVASMAELINAATNALETLNKIVLSTKKNTTAIKIKEMDIASKKELQETQSDNKLQLTREEIFKALINNAKPIEAELIENKKIED
jgi:hypothetical protein